MIDASAFNFASMKEEVGVDPFAQEASRYATDERFYTLKKDKEGSGAALIRFLPDSEKGMIQKLYSINTTILKNDKKRFVSEYSPSSIGQPCPFQEKWQALWNSGDKEGAKIFGRGIRYIANIKVLKDPAAPENEGKIFLYAMSGKMKDKIQAAVDPSEQDRALGAQPKELFNPLAGNSFRLVAKKGSNGQINYDNTEVVADTSSIYDSVDDALADIKENTHLLSDLLKPEAFSTYEKLSERLKWVTFQDNEAVEVAADVPAAAGALAADAAVASVATPEVQPAKQEPAKQEPAKQEPATPEPAKQESLDDLLNGLV